jgi:hypothetical protein
MNERIRLLADQANLYARSDNSSMLFENLQKRYTEKFAELIIGKTLDEVQERAYYSGDRAWSDEEDRKWVELEFGIGE